MNEILYEGERLFLGNLGHFAVALAFGASLFSTLAFLFATNQKDVAASQSWSRLGKLSFYIHSAAVLTIVIALFFIIQKHFFEYHYAWQHSSTDLPLRYMISCFWEGQEGSFLLWMFWHVVIGNILIRSARDWTNPVMTTVSLAQVTLSSMLLGITILGYKVGSSPFELLRNALDAPIFQQPDYLSKIKDGTGLNPLLQNYWMVIHPPTLFFGFATTIVPFAYAVAALWTKRYTNWIKPSLPWALISVMVLGTGIIMGGFWAYEALSFGGYWAWDPVENASLIPWLILIGGVHTMVIYKSSGNSLIVSYLLVISTFILVLYATFLTRSGILGDSSVHAFTDLGMSGQLLLFMFLFLAIALVLMIARWKAIPRSGKDEQIYSREFWMFIGSLLLVVSAFQVLTTTSIPVFNKIFGSNLAPPTDPIAHYNKWQLPIAILIALVSGLSQLLKYKKTKSSTFLKKLGLQSLISLGLSWGAYYLLGLNSQGSQLLVPAYFILLWASIFTILSNLSILFPLTKGKFKIAGSSVSHIGFGILLVGVLVSSVNKNVISINNSGKRFFEGTDENTIKENAENIYLERDKPVQMQDYTVTYLGDSTNWVNTYYRIQYVKTNPETGEELERFTLFPNAQVNPKMGLIPNPDTKHYFTHDVFTHVTSVPKNDPAATKEYVNEKDYEFNIGDTVLTKKAIVILESIITDIPKNSPDLQELELLVGAKLQVVTIDSSFSTTPLYGIQDRTAVSIDSFIEEAGLRLRLKKINTNSGTFTIEVAEKSATTDFIIMKAIVFPYINFVWGGTIIMVIGFLMAVRRRIKEYRRSS